LADPAIWRFTPYRAIRQTTALCTNAAFPRLALFIHPANDRFEPTT
jgi:hypothetical protein